MDVHSQVSPAQQWIDAGIRKQEDAAIARVLGWMLLWFDAIPAVFIWVGLRCGSLFWVWWALIEAMLGLGIIAAARTTHLRAARLIGRGVAKQAEAERARQAAEAPMSLAA